MAEDGGVCGQGGRPVAVLLPGAGSSADFVTRAFGGPLRAAGYDLVAGAPAPGGSVVEASFGVLAAARRSYGPRLRIVGGVSLGAHVAARWVAGSAGIGPDGPDGLDGLLLALPAWTGAPGAVAGATAAAAGEVTRWGVAGAASRAARGGEPWIAAELAAAWPAYGDRLPATLRAAATAAGPSPGELRSLDVPAGVVSFVDDPLHPLAVGEEWVALLPRAALARLRLADVASDRSVLGSAALRALSGCASTPPR